MVLPRIEHLEQGTRRVSAKVGADFVDFIEHEHRIACAGAPELLDKAARHGTDVGAAMTANFSFVADSPQAHA